MRSAIEFHLDGIRADGLAMPKPCTRVSCVEVAGWRHSVSPSSAPSALTRSYTRQSGWRSQ